MKNRQFKPEDFYILNDQITPQGYVAVRCNPLHLTMFVSGKKEEKGKILKACIALADKVLSEQDR